MGNRIGESSFRAALKMYRESISTWLNAEPNTKSEEVRSPRRILASSHGEAWRGVHNVPMQWYSSILRECSSDATSQNQASHVTPSSKRPAIRE